VIDGGTASFLLKYLKRVDGDDERCSSLFFLPPNLPNSMHNPVKLKLVRFGERIFPNNRNNTSNMSLLRASLFDLRSSSVVFPADEDDTSTSEEIWFLFMKIEEDTVTCLECFFDIAIIMATV